MKKRPSRAEIEAAVDRLLFDYDQILADMRHPIHPFVESLLSRGRARLRRDYLQGIEADPDPLGTIEEGRRMLQRVRFMDLRVLVTDVREGSA